jgi:hypothetical protein
MARCPVQGVECLGTANPAQCASRLFDQEGVFFGRDDSYQVIDGLRHTLCTEQKDRAPANLRDRVFHSGA